MNNNTEFPEYIKVSAKCVLAKVKNSCINDQVQYSRSHKDHLSLLVGIQNNRFVVTRCIKSNYHGKEVTASTCEEYSKAK